MGRKLCIHLGSVINYTYCIAYIHFCSVKQGLGFASMAAQCIQPSKAIEIGAIRAFKIRVFKIRAFKIGAHTLRAYSIMAYREGGGR